MLTLMTVIMFSSMLFTLLTHPISMGAMLLISTVSVSLTMGMFNHNYWYSYLLFLIMIGGMLVLFAYMTSVASNEKFTFSFKIFLLISAMTLLTTILFLMMDSYLPTINNFYMENMESTNNFKLSLNKFINYPSNIIMFMMIIYLLITLIAVVKITNISKGPLRQLN